MKTYRFVAFSIAKPGREAELETWYDNRHIPDCLRLDGFVAAQRFRIHQAPLGTQVPQWQFMVIYDIETDDIDATLAQIGQLARTPAMPITDALDMSTSLRLVGEAVTQRFVSQL
ncbi:MAG: hypothetical protein ABW034_23250 [Steroidobacteraceae bacterium]